MKQWNSRHMGLSAGSKKKKRAAALLHGCSKNSQSRSVQQNKWAPCCSNWEDSVDEQKQAGCTSGAVNRGACSPTPPHTPPHPPTPLSLFDWDLNPWQLSVDSLSICCREPKMAALQWFQQTTGHQLIVPWQRLRNEHGDSSAVKRFEGLIVRWQPDPGGLRDTLINWSCGCRVGETPLLLQLYIPPSFQGHDGALILHHNYPALLFTQLQ